MKIAFARDVTMTVVDQGGVIFDARRGRYWQVNGPAAAALAHLLAGEPISQAVEVVRGRSTVSIQQATIDLRRLVDDLHRARLVVIEG